MVDNNLIMTKFIGHCHTNKLTVISHMVLMDILKSMFIFLQANFTMHYAGYSNEGTARASRFKPLILWAGKTKQNTCIGS